MNWFGFELSAFLIIFVVLNIVNVVVQTVKSIVTVNGSPMSAAMVNAVTFFLYTFVVIYMTAEGLGLFWKALIIGVVNFIGVYVVKLIEEKAKKDKLWKIELAIPSHYPVSLIKKQIEQAGVHCNYVEVGHWVMFNCYCETQEQSKAMTEIAKRFEGKISAYESKPL